MFEVFSMIPEVAPRLTTPATVWLEPLRRMIGALPLALRVMTVEAAVWLSYVPGAA